ncbi:hypothetical protein SPRG_04446 [Saprolegnia parasitica CBS 223.65]|uniref:Uncharacterized protein n=1 Tax=Saprolegnia parasitica (strain CBS 223.65) TaxID=695850 RepID=A0A067CMT4_SAPPC|nr:hypothetical protein SPRG_04446 [Saprolegnia parasitica CBS 223.65]KDO30545.1 hypothetical protein SPRG_04446 [Saprolegnia parasitica CBS 223.65]|eukprot:XP_012198760.1 hypothetical protein SPRG_04446 [Saprolegnia parasitica CBS 223.65]
MYRRLLASHPLLTKSVTTGAIFGVGDVIAQSLFRDEDEAFSATRLGMTSLYGLAFQGPLLHVWFGRLEALWPVTNAVSIAKKMLVQQFAFAPISIMAFNSYAGCIPTRHEARSLEDRFASGVDKALDRAPSIWMAGNYFWIPMNILTFGFTPLPLRPLVSSSGNIVWSSYLSFRANEANVVALSPECSPLSVQ